MSLATIPYRPFYVISIISMLIKAYHFLRFSILLTKQLESSSFVSLLSKMISIFSDNKWQLPSWHSSLLLQVTPTLCRKQTVYRPISKHKKHHYFFSSHFMLLRWILSNTRFVNRYSIFNIQRVDSIRIDVWICLLIINIKVFENFKA